MRPLFPEEAGSREISVGLRWPVGQSGDEKHAGPAALEGSARRLSSPTYHANPSTRGFLEPPDPQRRVTVQWVVPPWRPGQVRRTGSSKGCAGEGPPEA